jgi:hypothetical protein
VEIIEDNSNVEMLDQIGDSKTRTVGPMDRFTMPMKPSTLANTKMMMQQKITEKIWKERMHNLKQYIAKWVYVRGKYRCPLSITLYFQLYLF